MRRENIQNVYMFDTRLENIVINEHLVFAPGDFVKVYLVGLMYADMNKAVDNSEVAVTVGIKEDKVKEAWEYWEKAGIVDIKDEEIVFKNVKEALLTCSLTENSSNEQNDINKDVKSSSNSNSHPLISKDLSELFDKLEKIGNKPLSYVNVDKIRELVDGFSVDEEIIILAHELALKKKVGSIYEYAYKTVINWTEKGLDSIEAVREHLHNSDSRYHVYRTVMKYLGFMRNATKPEQEVIDKWIDDDMSLDEILEACKKTLSIPNPNLNYVDAVIKNEKKKEKGIDEEGKVTRKKLNEYMEHVRTQAEDNRNALVSKIEKEYPQIAELSEDIRSLSLQLIKATVGSGADIDNIKAKVDNKTKTLDRMLHSNNIPRDYMEIKYLCPICQDTCLLDDGRSCKCLPLRESEAKNWIKNS